MIFFLISCFTFVFFLKSFSSKPIPSTKSEWKLSNFLALWLQKGRLLLSFDQVPGGAKAMTLERIKLGLKEKHQVEVLEEKSACLLDLPELALENILERLPPSGLCNMAGVCRYMRERCTSDHLWEKHLKLKWGGLIGDAAFREWQYQLSCSSSSGISSGKFEKSSQNGVLGWSPRSVWVWPFSWVRPKMENRSKSRTSLPFDSIMALFIALESGKFWFPAQVYNREKGHVGFMLSCYDAKLSYDSQTDMFQARYSPHGRRMIEENISWDRLRAPPVNTPGDALHISDCLDELKPGDHVEIQWRRSNEFPYGWWYAVVAHLDACDGNENLCHCQYSEKVVLKFNQYTPGSRWRQTIIDRKEHQLEGNEADGFYGGIRKLYKQKEILTWKQLWPSQVYD